MAAIRHVTFSERERIAELHPELSRQFPKLGIPYLIEATDYPDDFPYVFYALEDGTVATYISCFFDTLYRDGQQFGWAWNANLFTHTAFRGRGLAREVVEYQLAQFAKLGLIWGGTFSSPMALRLYEKLDFTIVGFAARMCLLRDPRPFLAHHTRSRTMIGGLSGLYRALFRVLGAMRFFQSDFERHYGVEHLSIDQLAELLREHPIEYQGRAHWKDGAEILRAKMKVRQCDKICLVRDKVGRPLLFFLWRARKTTERPIKEKYSGVGMFSVMEFGYLSEDVSPNVLLRAAISMFKGTGADLLEIISLPDLEPSARKHGFVSLGSGMSFTFKAPPGHPVDKVLTNLSDWHLTHYSGDAYSFE